jgi:anti-sigma regulatory factor (Ser/Thr protein kinase)
VDAKQPRTHTADWAGSSSPSLGTNSTGVGLKQISVQFDRGPAAVSMARSALMPLDERVDPSLLDDIRLLVSELVTNSIRHADGALDGTVGLQVNVQPQGVRVEVTDAGSGFDPHPRQGDKEKVGGWGLYLVDKLSDRWGVNRNGHSHVWFEIDGGARLRPQAVL